MSWRRYLEDPALGEFVACADGDTRMLVRRGYEEYADQLGLHGAPESAEAVSGGRQAHPRIRLPNGEQAVVRTYRRGGMLRHLNRARYFLGHRALDELRATERARAGGVRVAPVLAAAERRRPLGYTATLATRWIADAADGAAWLRSAQPKARAEVLQESGHQIARMHAAGVAHPDLNLRNLLIAEPPDPSGAPVVYLLDFDRARIFPGPVPAARRIRDLRRLARSVRKLRAPVSARDWQALRAGYGPEWPLGSALG